MRVGTFSKDIHLIKHINRFLKTDHLTLFPSPSTCQNLDLIVGWGQELNATNARQSAKFYGIKFQTIEDGFIGCGKNGMPRISIVLDSSGIHYDSSKPSKLETMLNTEDKTFNTKLMADAKKAIQVFHQHALSKYEGTEAIPSERFPSNQRKILIVDQWIDDPSIKFGAGVNADDIVATVLAENPDAKIYIRLFPESFAGSQQSILSHYHKHPQIELILENYNPPALLTAMDKIYVASSHIGFEALLLEKEVVCFGLPFYAGWGITDDRTACYRRQAQRTKEEIFAAAYMLYSQYVHPVSGRHCDIFSALNYIIEQKKIERDNQADIYCFGVRHWTRANIKPFLRSSKNKVFFVNSVNTAKQAGIKKGDRVAVWGARKPDRLEELIAITGQPPISLENGFLQSLGFESNTSRPASLIMDNQNNFQDASMPWALESILQNMLFTTSQLNKADSIREKISTLRASKKVLQTDAGTDQTIIFIPGQIEKDNEAVTSDEISTNLALIQSVRKTNPDAWLIYKPHPQVAHGKSSGNIHADTVLTYCDQFVEISNIETCLETADEIHTLSSIVGFEALIRGIPVTTYGKPFYAGWNLTTDHSSFPNRNRSLLVNELIAGALLQYPRYYDWDSGSFTDCESVIDKFIANTQLEPEGSTTKILSNYGTKHVKKLKTLVQGLIS